MFNDIKCQWDFTNFYYNCNRVFFKEKKRQIIVLQKLKNLDKRK